MKVMLAVLLIALLSGCGSYVGVPQIRAGQRFIMEMDQASAIANNDDEDTAAKRRDDRLRGS